MLGKASDAVPVLDRAAKVDSSPIAAMLDARAHATPGDVVGARPIYERALAAEKDIRPPRSRSIGPRPSSPAAIRSSR